MAEKWFTPLLMSREGRALRLSCTAITSSTPGRANRGGDIGSAQNTSSARPVIATKVRRTHR